MTTFAHTRTTHFARTLPPVNRLRSLLSFLALTILAAQLTGQGTWPTGEAAKLHERAVRAERILACMDAWRRAGEEDRLRALEAWRELRGPSLPAGHPPTLEHVALMTHVLAGVDLDTALADRMQRFADAVDLQVAPGAFGASDDGDGVACVVRVRRLWNVRMEGDLAVSLHWIGPGGRSIQARIEPVSASSFTKSFLMFVRTPVSGPGWWRLVPRIGPRTGEGSSAEGPGVPVECVAELDFLRSFLSTEPGGWSEEEPDLRALFASGQRFANGAPASLWLLRKSAYATEEDLARPFFRALPPEAGGEPAAVRAHGTWPPPADERAAVVFLASSAEDAPTFFELSLGSAYDLVDEGVSVFGVRLDPRQPEALRRFLVAQKERLGERPLVLAPRGDTVTQVRRLLSRTQDGPWPADGLVLVSGEHRLGGILPDVPAIRIGGEPSPRPASAGSDAPGGFFDRRPAWMLDADYFPFLASWLNEAFPTERTR